MLTSRRAIAPQPGSTTPLSPAIIVDGVVYCSGQVGRDPATGVLPEDIRGQARNTIENLRRSEERRVGKECRL